MATLPTVKELQAKIALAESAKASAALKAQAAADAEKRELIERLSRPSGLSDDQVMDKAAVIINRLGRTRDAAYWQGQLEEQFGELVAGPVRLRAAVAEAAAQSLPLSELGSRSGADEARTEFDTVLDRLVDPVA